MNKNFFTHDEQRALNEIVFEHRNKEYGAYVLRNEADNMLQKALFIGVALFATLAIVPFVVSRLNQTDNVIENDGRIRLINVDPQIEKLVDSVKPIVAPPKPDVPVKTQSLTPPEPTRDATNEQTINQKVDDAVISTQTSPGISVTNPNQHLNPTSDIGTKPALDTTPKPDPNAIPISVDVEANFVGGIDGFRTKVLNNFDTSVVESEGEVIKAVVTFVVERDGTISNIKASGNNADFNREAEKVIKSIKGKWNPAKLGGQNVRSYFRFPISMQFE